MGTVYTPEIADIILARISEGLTVQAAIKGIGFPSLPEFYAWLRESEEFRRAYGIARECKADTLVEEALELSDDVPEDKDAIAKATLQVNTRKWIAARFLPKVYGDKVEHSGEITNPYAATPIPVTERNTDRLGTATRPPEKRH